jgi:transcriptional regulator with XRE-family HTH domain
MYLALNLKYLRNKHGQSQQQLSETLGIGRSTLAEYEREKTEPNVATLVKIAEHFKISIDDLLLKNLMHDAYEIIRSNQLRVLAITLDPSNKGNIELVDSKAEAGYLENAQDPEYIKELPRIYFPNMPEGTYRGFEIQGESMLPIESGSIIICRYTEKINYIKNNKTYIIITQRDGLVYKRVFVNREDQTLILQSDNTLYLPYEVAWEDVSEIWEYHAHLSFSDTKQNMETVIEEKLNDIQKKLSELHRQYNIKL